jgi:hypothetical protein
MKRRTQLERETIIDLYAKGFTSHEVADQMGLARSSVFYVLKQAGATRTPSESQRSVMSLNERFWQYADKRLGDAKCWVWTGARTGAGYGAFTVRDFERGSTNTVLAHRFAYESIRGPIPDGLGLDHLCRNRSCVNPLHLEPVTARTNTLRGIGPSARNAAQSYCKRGHELSGANVQVWNAHRRCNTCRRLREKLGSAASLDLLLKENR